SPSWSSTTYTPVLSDRSRPIVSFKLLPFVIAGPLLCTSSACLLSDFTSARWRDRPSHSISPSRGRGLDGVRGSLLAVQRSGFGSQGACPAGRRGGAPLCVGGTNEAIG